MSLAVEMQRVSVQRDLTLALDDVSLSIDSGTVTAVIGPNGAGKSTMFGVISGRINPTSGTVSTFGAVADVLQATSVDPQLSLTVEDVVRMGRYATQGLFGRHTEADREACRDAIERVGLTELRRRPINELSGGQRQRALVAQGIAQDAPLLILDEPATGLDVTSRQSILEVIRDEAEAGRAVLFSTHQLDDANLADTVVALDCRCVCCTDPVTAMADPLVVGLFDRSAFAAPGN